MRWRYHAHVEVRATIRDNFLPLEAICFPLCALFLSFIQGEYFLENIFRAVVRGLVPC